MRRVALFLLPLTVACNGEPEDTDPGTIECVADGTYDVEIRGTVEDAAGNAVSGAAVELLDYGWSGGASLGSATTDGSGEFLLDAVGITDVPNCWGTVLNYTLDASEGGRTGERTINSFLHSAISDNSLTTDVRAFPIAIE